MNQRTRLLCIAAGLFAAACSDATAPRTQPALSVPASASHDDIDPLPDGTCRSGYMVSNGRCVPI